MAHGERNDSAATRHGGQPGDGASASGREQVGGGGAPFDAGYAASVVISTHIGLAPTAYVSSAVNAPVSPSMR